GYTSQSYRSNGIFNPERAGAATTAIHSPSWKSLSVKDEMLHVLLHQICKDETLQVNLAKAAMKMEAASCLCQCHKEGGFFKWFLSKAAMKTKTTNYLNQRPNEGVR
ncbi:hypothetical protein HAX54_039131, partial [Datura stramonium]|nr:hypothetical protein [Datura stramonium]